MTLVICRNRKLISVLREGIFSTAYPCKNTTYCQPYQIIAYPGKYLLEVWGAEGSTVFNKSGGKGGYSRGILTLDQRVNMFVHIGGKGEFRGNETVNRPSNNGGGKSHFEDREWQSLVLWYGSGGGATDIRLKYDENQYRLIVAGGGGTAAAYYSYQSGAKSSGYGGFGGGLAGGDGEEDPTYEGYGGSGGTQTDSMGPIRGTLGKGGSRGAGGGFWGGSGSYYGQGTGGGSGFVFTEPVDNISLSSLYYLTDAQTISGNETFPSLRGTEEKGHRGNGAVRITILEKYSFPFYLCSQHAKNIMLSSSFFIIFFFSS